MATTNQMNNHKVYTPEPGRPKYGEPGWTHLWIPKDNTLEYLTPARFRLKTVRRSPSWSLDQPIPGAPEEVAHLFQLPPRPRRFVAWLRTDDTIDDERYEYRWVAYNAPTQKELEEQIRGTGHWNEEDVLQELFS